MYLMTCHKTFLGYDDAARLIHTSVSDQSGPTDFGFISPDLPNEAGPLAGFTTVGVRGGLAFVKDDLYLCADPNLKHLMHNRQRPQQWETFVPVPEDRLRFALEFNQSPEKEMQRFSAAVARLVEMGRHVKVQVGCGHNPRPGYLNVDALWHKLDFGITHPDQYFIFPFVDTAWDIPDNSVDYIFHEDFIEHISQLQQIQFLAEAWRVLKPGCYHRVNTPSLIEAMRRNSRFAEGFKGVYTGELQYEHVAIFTHFSLKEIAELVGYRDVIFTTKHHGVSPFSENDIRPLGDRDDVVGNIFADLRK